MTDSTRTELNKYASSSFSGADIRVIANLNTYGLDKVKARISKLQGEMASLETSRTFKSTSLASWEEIKKSNHNILTGGDLSPIYDVAVDDLEIATTNLRTQQSNTETKEATKKTIIENLTNNESALFTATLVYQGCLALLTDVTDISPCDGEASDVAAAEVLVASAKAALELVKDQIAVSKTAEASLKAIQEEKQAVVDSLKGASGDLEDNVSNAIKFIAFLTKQLKASEDPLKNLKKELASFQKILGSSLLELGTVQTISCQSHRPKAAVRALGSTYARGYTRGPRTIAGSMIFTVINKQSLSHLCDLMSSMYNSKGNDILPSTILPDQLLPLDLTFIMANEYGAVSRMALYGLEFLNTGYTFSIEDLLLEEVVQFVARDIDPMSSAFDPQNHQKSRQDTLRDKPITGKDTLRDYLVTRQKTLDRRRF